MYYQLWHKIIIEIRIETITYHIHNKIYQILLFWSSTFSVLNLMLSLIYLFSFYTYLLNLQFVHAIF